MFTFKAVFFCGNKDIDARAAFDTIYRKLQLQILKRIINEDELRSIPFLLSIVVSNTKVKKAGIKTPFTNNVATQGDGLSPVLFHIIKFNYTPMK